ncbi:MAG TPA: ABC transporter ATP-binding protein [Longimicrobiaceae bacterium]
MIRYEGVTKHFGRLVALAGLDLEVRPGETIALVGPNGSGKSTTLKAALALVRPTRGRVTVDGVDVATHGREARARLGYLPQGLSFPQGFTAGELMRYFARLRGADPGSAAQLLDRVGLQDAEDRHATTFSGGMKQRLGLAVALLGNPRALILDEPTAALDPSGALAVRDLLREIRAEGTTILLSSHDLGEVAALADRVAVFVAGRLVALGTVDELVETYVPHRDLRERRLEEAYRVIAGGSAGRAA